ncbi:hypothetical protein AURDEDRAFT_161064 [Auricularia subglabra TFB-10046 SS5]|nr:hypothetical protein AURDEDRAFT_161064 [Auricularia subglabra TFB-10046 SS5]
MSGPLLKAQENLAISHVRKEVSGRLAMAQWDGWKNVARKSVITCMMTVQNKAHLVRSHNTFGKPKTGNFLWELAQSDIDYMTRTFGVELIRICTDDGPDGKRMRRLARTAHLHLVVLVCWAHQNQLIIGDLIKNDPELKALLNWALDVSKWFLNHSAALEHLHEEQTLHLGCAIALTLLLPVITRWGAHYCSTSRLLRLKQAVQMACPRHANDWLAFRTRSDSKEEGRAHRAPRTETVIQMIKNDQFWKDLLCTKEHLELLAVASHILQSDRTRPDHVTFALGNYVRIYNQPHVKPSIRNTVLPNVEKRWDKADQEVFIAAVLLNPYVRHACFSNALPRNTAVETCIRVYERIFRQPGTVEFWEVCHRYLRRVDPYSDASFALAYHEKVAERDDEEPNLVAIWEAQQLPTASTLGEKAHNALVLLAIRILSVVANSGACEHGFSGFGVMQT